MNEIKPHTMIYEPEYPIVGDDKFTRYYRPNVTVCSDGQITISHISIKGANQMKKYLRNLIKTIESLPTPNVSNDM